MAVPFINFLAPSMGGIGPIELADFSKLQTLQSKNGVPFYAGRFYPKDNQAIIDGFNLGLISQTPPWLTWEEIKPTQIWMVPAFEDERIVTMNVTIERIDLWPREVADYEGMDEQTANDLVTYEPKQYGGDVIEKAWGQLNLLPSFNGSLDPAVEIAQNLNYIPPIITLGYLGIAEVSGYCSEWGFYDQELTIVNGTDYGQPQYGYGGADELGYNYTEVVQVRPDGAWVYRDADISEGAIPKYDDNKALYEPFIQQASYLNSAIYDEQLGRTFGNAYWENRTKREDSGNPRAGMIAEVKTSEMDCVVYTIKVACTTIVVPDVLTGPDEVVRQELGSAALETFASNLSNNIWYFYLPVRYNAEVPNERIQHLYEQAGINNVDFDEV
ncbi:hypothetical protein PQC11_gp061 [Synechococcus phage S-H9-1]|uniref:Uncharacterized protein n=1 Tax=Synechococcus phage S-H9-1 TaxID=2783674 RepID=A0A873WAL6_9CAUD|nr:hypothetical protein PQC11_gp061 [Synechococcus phage S-H9-1]QPB08267.1 hypothetical protein [Synechococcus phage S-H9-1]